VGRVSYSSLQGAVIGAPAGYYNPMPNSKQAAPPPGGPFHVRFRQDHSASGIRERKTGEYSSRRVTGERTKSKIKKKGPSKEKVGRHPQPSFKSDLSKETPISTQHLN